MNITLRKANNIQHAINEAIRGISIDTKVSVNEFQDPELILTEANKTLLENDRKRALLLTVLYNIRGLVDQANHESGINLLLTKSALAEKRINQVSQLAGAEPVTELVVIQGKLEKLRNSETKSRIYGYDESVSTGVVSKADIDSFKKEVAELKKQRQKYADEILHLNVKTEIPLSEDAVKILTEFEII